MYTHSFYVVLIAIPNFVYYNKVNYYKVAKVLNVENSSIFGNRIEEWLKDFGLPYISQVEAMIILLSVVLILLFLLWIVFRKARLWYWKTDVQLDMLKSIESHLKSVEEKFSQNPPTLTEEADGEIECQKNVTDDLPKEKVIQNCAAQDLEGLTAIGKSGRIYTEAELELQIRE